ncbi:MAG TPA: hypothetical protein VJ787_00375 [Thermoleophilia bacterium]|nr:hypothetical protein [Thermoleophilia bacterium]
MHATRMAAWNEMNPITVVIAPERAHVRMLVRSGGRDVLKAVLGPARQAHPRAAATLLEGLALWHQQALGVVLCADDPLPGATLGLCDALGFGLRNVHYEVGIAYAGARRRPLTGVGDFSDLRQLDLAEVQP